MSSTSTGAAPPEKSQPPTQGDVDKKKDVDTTKRYVGVCKWFNVLKGYGFVNPDGMELDVFVHQTVLGMEGFRSLAEGERVSFNMRPNTSGKGGWEAHKVGPEDENEKLKGSEIRPIGKKKEKMIRCYKCGQFGHHTAAKCRKEIPSGTKSCYKCQSTEHLVENCPLNPIKRSRPGKTSPVEKAPGAEKAKAEASH